MSIVGSLRKELTIHLSYGFSLLELIIALVISAILSCIAYPFYSSFHARAARHQTEAAMMQIAVALTDYYLHHQTYTGAKGRFTSNSAYSIAVRLSDDAYTIKATPKENQSSHDHCGILTLNDEGEKTASGADRCW